jgi:hypothetical protein
MYRYEFIADNLRDLMIALDAYARAGWKVVSFGLNEATGKAWLFLELWVG